MGVRLRGEGAGDEDGVEGEGADGLYFSFNGAAVGSYNESMSVSDDGYALFLEPLGMARFFAQREDPSLTMEGAAEYFRSLFVGRLR